MDNPGKVILIDEGIKSFGVVFGEHFDGGGELLVEAGNETISRLVARGLSLVVEILRLGL